MRAPPFDVVRLDVEPAAPELARAGARASPGSSLSSQPVLVEPDRRDRAALVGDHRRQHRQPSARPAAATRSAPRRRSPPPARRTGRRSGSRRPSAGSREGRCSSRSRIVASPSLRRRAAIFGPTPVSESSVASRRSGCDAPRRRGHASGRSTLAKAVGRVTRFEYRNRSGAPRPRSAGCGSLRASRPRRERFATPSQRAAWARAPSRAPCPGGEEDDRSNATGHRYAGLSRTTASRPPPGARRSSASPPSAAASRRTIASPRPDPGPFPGPRQNRSKARLRSSSVSPGPWSTT